MKKIAVVEDNEDNRVLLSALLEDEYELVEYVDGPTALAGIVEQGPALVLLDISLPGMDGTEVLAALRADEATKGIPAIALTAHAMAGDREKYLEQGFDDYITKPIVDEEVLLEAIQRLVSSG